MIQRRYLLPTRTSATAEKQRVFLGWLTIVQFTEHHSYTVQLPV